MRFLGVDLGLRRIGLAVSDGSAMLARPWRAVLAGPTPDASADVILRAASECLRELDEPSLEGIVVGLPRRLSGEETEQTRLARAVGAALMMKGAPPVHLQDERLSSREAERLLAEREPDWRARKKKLDAASAAIILQDFLDARPRSQADAAGESC